MFISEVSIVADVFLLRTDIHSLTVANRRTAGERRGCS